MRVILVTALILVTATSCVNFSSAERGNGDMTEVSFEVEDFSKLRISGAYEVTLIASEEESVDVVIDENLEEFLIVEVRGSTLVIDNSEKIYSRKGIELMVYYKEIEEIDVSGAVSLETEGTVKSDVLYLDMSGAGAVDMEVEVNELRMDIGGAGAVKLSGEAGHQTIQMSGAGGYDGFDLVTQTAEVRISGVGSADIFVEESLDASISGLGGVTYKGNPDDVKSDVSGLGAIRGAD